MRMLVPAIMALIPLLCACGQYQQKWVPKTVVGMDYPALGRAARIEGQVEVVCMINPDGTVSSSKVIGDPHPVLANAAMRNASKWTFAENSHAAKSPDTVTLVYSFKMEENVSQPMDETVSHHPARQFVFEFPSKVKISSEYCRLESSCY